MPTVAALFTRMRTLTRATTSDLTDQLGFDALNTALDRMQNTGNWRGQETSDDTLVYGQTTDGLALPADFVSDEAVWRQVAGASNPSAALLPVDKLPSRRFWIERNLRTADPKTNRYVGAGGQTLSGPSYYLWAEKLYYVPNPSDDVNLTLDYYARLAAFTSTTNSNFFTNTYPEVLVWLGLSEVWAAFQDDERAAAAEARGQGLLNLAMKNERQLAGSGGPRQRGT